ncbi:MFS transporter [Novosphingobium resinovorum]|uniref:MFS transporter n=1 Tax=Novosphingobium resinovorum TaxID=158500 RepID=UPI002ED4782D|nr:MFS transporter [Novosphingobium resinovorum]
MDWFRALDGRQRKAFWACFGGWALDAMDVQLYALLLPTIMAIWSLTKAEAGTLGTVALLASSLGGAIAGNLADRIGRVRILQLSILWFSTFTFLSGLAQNYEQLLVARTLQGLGFGGEWAAGAVLMAELISPKHRGQTIAAVSSGWSVGYAAAAILFALIFNFVEAETAWRVMFFLGILPALLILFVRRHVPEPEMYAKAKRADADAPQPRFSEIFRGTLGARTLVAWLTCLGVLGGNYTVLTWLPAYLQSERGLSYSNTGLFLLVNIVGSFVGYLVGGAASDRFGRKNALRLFALLGTLSVGSYLLFGGSSAAILLLGFPLGFAQSGMNAGIAPLLSELYPTRLRATGQGFTYNAGRGTGALFPMLVGIAAAHVSLTVAIAAGAACAYALVVLASIALPETRDRQLEEIGTGAL